jgi:NitT/TauT family transport system ATP-binding protein
MSLPHPALEFAAVALELGGRAILEDIDFTVARGEFVCIIGASGCGKTTLLRLLAGLIAPSRGKVSLDGHLVAAPSPQVALVFQDYGRALLPWRTATGNVSLALEAMGVPVAAPPCSPRPVLSAMPKSIRANFPAACSSVCRLPAAWPRIPPCC